MRSLVRKDPGRAIGPPTVSLWRYTVFTSPRPGSLSWNSW